MPLGSWNEVPGHPDWLYGLAVRNADRSLTVEVTNRETRESFEVSSLYWNTIGDARGIHELAQTEIESRQQR